METNPKCKVGFSVKNESKNPPKWAEKLLEKVCRSDYSEEIIGDLNEAFQWRSKEKGKRIADIKYVWEAFASMRPRNLKPFHFYSINTMIFNNYIKVAFRTLLKRKSTSFINLFGLSLGATAFLLIGLYAYQILTFDHIHIRKDRIFLAYKERITPNGIQPAYDTWIPMANRLIDEYPQITKATKFYETEAKVVDGTKFSTESLSYADNDFFEIFSSEILSGSESQPIQNTSSVVLSKSMAVKYFKSESPVGELLTLFIPEEDTTITYQVSAIINDYPTNSSIRPGIIVLPESVRFFQENANRWSGSFLETFVLLDDPQSVPTIEASFPDLIENIWDTEVRNNTNFKLLPYHSYYDTFIGDKSNAKTLLLIGIGILLIAIINFMNLSTAQASQRMKEIGLRKVLGAFRNQLRTQFIFEAFISSLIATGLGIALTKISIPYFNDFFEVTISIDSFSWLEIVSASVTLSLAIGLLSGSYPSIYLSSIRVIDALQQKIGLGGSINFRNALVVTQFSIALFLISSSLIIYRQISYMINAELGFDTEGIVMINASRNDFTDREDGLVRLNTLKTELKEKSYISQVTMSRSVPTSWTRSFVFVRPDGWDGDPLRMRYTFVDGNFFNTFNINLTNGEGFRSEDQRDQREVVVLNEAAFRAFEFNPEDQNFIKIGDQKIQVVGITQDFNFESLQNEVAPTLIFHRSASNSVHRFITCKMELSNLMTKMEEIETLWNSLGSTNEFTFEFLDENIANQYEAENLYLKLVTLFSSIAIVVACLGLYGLTLFVIEKRKKEMSIRKVLGAQLASLLLLVFKEFSKWVTIAFIISIPLVIYFVSDWLNAFHYRTHISWQVFGVTILLVFGLVILTVGYHSMKAANANPVDHLKDE